VLLSEVLFVKTDILFAVLGLPGGRQAASVGSRSEFQGCPLSRNPDCHPNGCVQQPQYGLHPGVLWGYASDDHHHRGCDGGRDDIFGPTNQN
jgi:hypothetical protein